MNFKIIVTVILVFACSFATQAQKIISSVEEVVEQIARQQRAEEKANPGLSKTRSGRISTKAEKAELKKIKSKRHQELAKALKTHKSKNGGKLKITTSKDKRQEPTKGTIKQPTKSTIKNQKIKE